MLVVVADELYNNDITNDDILCLFTGTCYNNTLT